MLALFGNTVLKTIIAGSVFGFLPATVTFADAPVSAPMASAASTPAVEMVSSLETDSSSRQSKTFSYKPYVNSLSNKNVPLVQVKINDTVSATLIFDTGTTVSIMTEELAHRLNLKIQPYLVQGKPSRLDGKPVNAVAVDLVNLGGFKVAKNIFVVADRKRFDLPNQPVDGILGMDTLHWFEYLFDFPQHQITMFAPVNLVAPDDNSPPKYIFQGLTPDELATLGFADAKSAALTKSAVDDRMFVHAQFSNNRKTGSEDLILDTGASITIVSPMLAKQIDLKPTYENVESTSFGENGFVSAAPVNQVQVGNLILNDQLLNYSSQTAYDKNIPLAFGTDIMSQYRVLLDFYNQKIYFKPNTPTPPTITITPQAAPPTQAPPPAHP